MTEFQMLVSKVKDHGGDALRTLHNLLQRHADLASQLKGVSFLEVKNHVLLAYMADLVLLMLKKVSGKSIQGHPAILRLVENRTIVEKLRPIDHKLKYQIDKLIKIAKQGITDELDPLRYKPNPDNLICKEDEESDEEEGEEREKTSKDIYKAPKLAPMPYNADESVEERSKKQAERLKRQALSSTMMEELRRDYMDEPEEIVESRDLHRVREDRKRKERTEYEETYFVRTSVSKRDLNSTKRLATISSLDGLLKFDNLAYLDGEEKKVAPLVKKKKNMKKLKGKKGKGSKKWHH